MSSLLVLLLINSSTQINLPCKPTNLNFISLDFVKIKIMLPLEYQEHQQIIEKGLQLQDRSIKQFKKNLMNLIV